MTATVARTPAHDVPFRAVLRAICIQVALQAMVSKCTFVDAWLVCCCTHKRSAQLQVQLCTQDAKLRHLPGDLVPALDPQVFAPPRSNIISSQQKLSVMIHQLEAAVFAPAVTHASLCLPRCLGDTRKATPRSKRAVRSCCSGLKLQALRAASWANLCHLATG